jgi:hypothetical protein
MNLRETEDLNVLLSYVLPEELEREFYEWVVQDTRQIHIATGAFIRIPQESSARYLLRTSRLNIEAAHTRLSKENLNYMLASDPSGRAKSILEGADGPRAAKFVQMVYKYRHNLFKNLTDLEIAMLEKF